MQEAIGRLILVKEALASADADKIFQYFLPEVAASNAQIIDLERAMNFPLPDQYKAFLSKANGWKSVLIDADLLSTNQIPAWQERVLRQRETMDVLRSQNVEAFLVIGASDAEDYLYLIEIGGRVHWCARGEVETFSGFSEFFLTLLAHNEKLLIEVQEGRWKL